MRTDAAHSNTWAAAHAYPVSAVGWTEILNEGFSGLVLQLLKSRSGDVDGQGVGLGFQVAGAFSQNTEHDLSHAEVSPSFRIHPWPAPSFWQVRPDTDNRLCG
jgi:hypothetical protein